MKILRPPKRTRVRFNQVAYLTYGGYNMSFMQRHLNPGARHHYTLSYSFTRRDFDLHLTWEGENKHHSLFKISEKNLIEYLDRSFENLAKHIRGAVFELGVTRGLERDGFFEHILPEKATLAKLVKDYSATFVEKKANEINFITDDDEVFKRAIGSGRYKKAYGLTKQFSRVGYPMRLWNFRSAMVSYKHLNLWILRYDKSQRRMICVDLNKLSLEELVQRTLEDTVGSDILAGLQAAIEKAPLTTADLPDGVFAPGFVDLR